MDYTQREHPPERGATASKDNAALHQMRDDLKAYQDGELSPLRRWWVGRHVEKCAACRAEITVLQRLERDMRELERAVPRPQLRARILANLPDAPPVARAASQRPAYARSVFSMARRPMPAAGGACAVLLLMVGALALNHWQRTVTRVGNGPVAAVVTPPAPDHIFTNNNGGVRNAPQSVELAHASLDPFSPRSSASVAPEVPSAQSQIASKTAGTHSSSQPSPVIPVNVANGEAYTDPTSREAEKLASRVLPGKLEAERHNAASPVLQTVHFVQQASKVKNGMAEATQVAFAVTDVSEARRQVQRWAEETGAKVTILADRAEGAGSGIEVSGGVPNTSGTGTWPGNAPSASSATLLKIQIPARQADLFKSRLNEMGTPLLPVGKAFRRLPHVAMVEDSMTENDVHALTAPVPVERSEKRAESSGHHEAKATVTILLRLQSGNQPLR